jgi:hypothetical protein
MRGMQVVLRIGGLAAFGCLAIGCNAILGVEDVAQQAPDAGGSGRDDASSTPGSAACDVSSHFGLVDSTSAISLLSRGDDGSPDLLISLTTDGEPDSLSMFLHSNQGGHGILEQNGTYAISAQDANPRTCGVCLVIGSDFDGADFSQFFWARAGGTLTIDSATATGLAGRIRDLTFRQVDIATGADVPSGCSVAIDNVHFDMMYATSAAPTLLHELVRGSRFR